MQGDSSYITITPQQAEGNHYNVINRVLRFGDVTCFFISLFSD